jgi:mannose-6-phosphate isomerase-like protein (cupin superfamily)
MTAPAKAELDVPAGGAVKDADWMQIAPGERLAMRISSGETNSRYAVMEVIAGPGFGPPLHIHQNEDEHFVVLEGSVSFVCGDRTFNATAGTAFTVPKGVPHTWANLSETDIRMLGVFVPGGLEQFFLKAQGVSASDIEALAASHGMVIVGPPIRG